MSPYELIVDSFAGGGGASLGIFQALDRHPDIAINHDKEAIALHAANHPESRHYAEDVWKVDPKEACGSRPVGLMWLSPDCKHFSKAKGGKPVSKKVRGLAWVAIRWAKAVRPRVIVLENVEEFQTWGPVLRDTNKPCPQRKGQTFRSFIRRLERLGYAVQWRQLRACDYGAPTIRRRLFLIARCDGKPIVWPAPTHGKHTPNPWRTAAECIDWSLACPSIFERKKPLAENTLKRIARGLDRFVLNNPRPFIVGVGGRQGQSPERSVDQPYQTITAKADSAIVVPHIVNMANGGSVEDCVKPFTTIMTERGGCRALVEPYLVEYHSPKTDGDDRVRSVEEPLPTQTVENRFGLVAPTLVHFKSDAPSSVTEPIPTQTSRDCFGLVAPTLIQTGYGEDQHRNNGAGQPPRALDLHQPLGTVVGGGVKHALVAAFLAKHYTERANQVQGASLFDPTPTVTAVDHNALVAATMVNLRGTDDSQLGGRSIEEPPATISGGGIHAAEVRAFLIQYYSQGSGREPRDLFSPMATVTSKERHAIVTVEGTEYVIADIGMRMLVPRELYNAQGFPANYRIDIEYQGKPLSKTAQVRMVGNSVCPPLAAAIVRANLLETAAEELVA